jgi:hypothetical protein
MSTGNTPASLSRLNMRWTWPALFCLVAVILFFRQPAAILHPFFVSEDGYVFFKDLYRNGFWASLFMHYAGYLHFAPRIAALCCSILPLEHIPAAYAVVSLLIAAATLTFFFAPGFRSVIDSDIIRVVVVVMFTLMPNADSLMRLTYLCWYLLFFIALMTLHPLPQRPVARWIFFVPVALSVWSAPLAMVCLPLILLRAWKANGSGERIWWIALTLAIFGFALTAESVPSVVMKALSQSGAGIGMVHAIGYRVFCYFFLGEAAAHPMPSVGWKAVTRLSLLLAGLCAIGTALASAKRFALSSFRFAPWVIFYLILALPAPFILRREWVADFLVWNENHSWIWHQRYFYPSTLLLCVLAGIVYERLFHVRIIADPRARVLAPIFFLGWLSLHLVRFPLWPWQPDTSWKHYARLIRAAEIRVQQSGGTETVHILTGETAWDFDLIIDRAAAIRDHCPVNSK